MSPLILEPTLKVDSASYEAKLPNNYYHILNCVCEFTPIKDFKCYKTDEPI
jgi:hypothetical protein